MPDGKSESVHIVVQYTISLLGADIFEAYEKFNAEVAGARRAYVEQIQQLAIKHELPPEKVNGLAALFLNPLATELFGFGKPIAEEMQQLRASQEELTKRLPEISLLDSLEKALEKRRQER